MGEVRLAGTARRDNDENIGNLFQYRTGFSQILVKCYTRK